MRRLEEKDLLNDSKKKENRNINSLDKQELIKLSWKLIEI